MWETFLFKAGLDSEFFADLKEDITLHKNCGWKLQMEIADNPLPDRLVLVLFFCRNGKIMLFLLTFFHDLVKECNIEIESIILFAINQIGDILNFSDTLWYQISKNVNNHIVYKRSNDLNFFCRDLNVFNASVNKS